MNVIDRIIALFDEAAAAFLARAAAATARLASGFARFCLEYVAARFAGADRLFERVLAA